MHKFSSASTPPLEQSRSVLTRPFLVLQMKQALGTTAIGTTLVGGRDWRPTPKSDRNEVTINECRKFAIHVKNWIADLTKWKNSTSGRAGGQQLR